MIGPQIFVTCRTLAHLVRKTLDMPGCYIHSLLTNCRAFYLIIPFRYYIELAPEVFDTTFDQRTKRAVIDKPCNLTVAFRRWPDKPSAFCQIHHIIKDIAHLGSQTGIHIAFNHDEDFLLHLPSLSSISMIMINPVHS